MSGIPLWISIFVAGLSVGFIFADSSQPPVSESTHSAIEITQNATSSVGPAEIVSVDSEVFTRLERRLAQLEDRVLVLEEVAIDDPVSLASSTDDVIDRQRAPFTAAEQSQALIMEGFDASRTDEILKLHDQLQLDRLEIRDRAVREGWLDTSAFRAALRDAGDEAARVRRELGDDEYDSYLHALGLSNRIALQTIIPQGEAALAGLLVGDVIVSYAGGRVFRLSELQEATSAGDRGELVPIQVLRGGDELQLYVPRGPLGVTISGLVQRPGE